MTKPYVVSARLGTLSLWAIHGRQHAETKEAGEYDVRCGEKWFIVAQSGAQWMARAGEKWSEESGRCSSALTLQDSTTKAA